MIGIILGIVAGFVVLVLLMYRQVSPSEAHVVVRPNSKFVVCTDSKISGASASNWYFFVPFITNVRILNITIKELAHSQQTFEKNFARFTANWSLKFHINNPLVASSKYIDDVTLSKQLTSIVESGVNTIASKYDIGDLRSKKMEIESDIKESIENDLNSWGVSLVNFQIMDFQDTEESKVITDLSLRREVEISSTTRQQNAEQLKQAESKEAEAREFAKTRNIQADETIAKREQTKFQTVAEEEKKAKEKEYEVIKVSTIAQATIDKDRQVIESERLKIEGEGYKLKQEQIAKGDAAQVRENGFAEAEAKEKLSDALKKFDEAALKALVAEKNVEKDRQIGVEAAKALQKASIFIGGGSGQSGFNLGQIMKGVEIVDPLAKAAMVDRMTTPNAIVHKKEEVKANG